MEKMNVCAILALLATLTFSAHARVERLESYVGKRILPHEVLRVKQELGLRQYQGIGKVLQSVSVVMTARRHGANATLYINQQPVSRPQFINPGQRSVARFTLPRGQRINENMRTVQVRFDGPVIVDTVRAQITDARQPNRRRRISKDVYRFQAGTAETISLTNLMDLGPRQQERRIESIKLTVRSLVGSANVSLCRANGNCVDQKRVRDGSEREITLSPNRTPKASRMSIQTSGMVFISKATVIFAD